MSKESHIPHAGVAAPVLFNGKMLRLPYFTRTVSSNPNASSILITEDILAS